ncbi:MAG TPA: hypothetical protein VMN57_07235 [Anaerolineales bacterium]|nr:hypothetical protein [Anaerolineales bacterium]
MKNRRSRPASRTAPKPARRSAPKPAQRHAPVARRSASIARRAVNKAQVHQKTIRQDAIRQQARQAQRIRPAVRPAAAPRRIMPKTRAPISVRTVPAARGNRIPKPTARPVKAGVHRAALKPAAPARRPASRTAPGIAGPAAGAAAVSAAAFMINQANAHPELAPELSTLQYSLSNLKNLSSFDDIRADLDDLDADLRHALSLLESARDQGFRYQKDLDELAVRTASGWQAVQAEVRTAVEREAAGFRTGLAPLNNQISQLNARLNSPTSAGVYLQAAETSVNKYLSDVTTSRRSVQARYSELESDTHQLTTRLTTIHWFLAQLAESKWALADGEDLVMGVKGRWDRQGDDDPEGILFLSNKRLAFERKEKVATKKILFITTAKELVQEVLIDEKKENIKGVKAHSKGLFGHQDFLEIDFSGGTGTVSLHLEGQDSKAWTSLIERVRSGKIEEDRAAVGGLSFQDLSGDLSQANIVAIQSEVNALQDDLQLSAPRAELEDLENEVRQLERDLGDLRARGYAIEKGLEGEIAILAAQWDRVKGNAYKTIDLQSGLLAEQSRAINATMSRLAGLSGNLVAARPAYMQLKSAIASAEAQTAAALDTVYRQFEDYAAEIEGLAAHLDWVDWMLDALSTASFRLMATESGVAAVEAFYARLGMEPENGILFLTEQRVIWEDRVGDYEVKLEAPLSQVDRVTVDIVDPDGEADEFLVFNFGAGAPVHEARIDIAANVGEDWTQMIGRARNGDYSTDRAIAIDPAELERIKNAPTQCTNCGAQFTAPILRGQVELVCEFCGVVARI